MTLISEPGLYQLAAQSKLPNAEPFQDWLFEDVLPSINETGSYSNPQYDDLAKWVSPEPNYGKFADLIPKNMGEALQLAANQQREIDDLKPKAENYEKYHSKAHTWTITQIVSNYGLEAVNVNQYLHSIGVQYKRGNHWYLYHAYKKQGLALQVGSNNIPITYLRWTDKGKEFIENILNSLGYVKNGGLVKQNDLF